MKFVTAATATALATLLPAVNADFVLFSQGVGGNGITGNSWGWQAYSSSEPSCDEGHDWIWRKKDDVSGRKYGVRCKGSCGGSSDPAEFEEVEMNFNSDDLHFSTRCIPSLSFHELTMVCSMVRVAQWLGPVRPQRQPNWHM
jgi:hypothetical protein